jgi:diaminopimelate decarboxylase
MSVTTQFSQLRQDIAGHSLVELADRFGTPSYVYDLSKILQRVADLQAFDTIRYAQKACSNIAILDRLRRADVLVDAVSTGEIGRALRAGYQPSQIVYTADVFDRDALELVIQKNVPVNVGSPDMIDQLGQRAPGRNITLRINPGFGHGHSQKTNTGGPQSKHGIWYQQIDDCLLRADRHGLVVTGLHIHIGSGTDFEHLSQVCGAMEQACLRVGRTVTTISTGGGLPVPYREGQSYIDLDQYYQLWNAARDRIAEQLGHSIHLEIEPGRYLVAESGYLVTEICAIKTMGENLFYLVDAGFSDLARPILYGAYHPISICHRNPPASDRQVEVVVGGPLCESGDIFTQEEGGFVSRRSLPVAQVGDLLVLEVAGAYGFAMSSNYNSRFRACEVLLEEGQAKQIRRRESLDELLELESIPAV